MRLGRSLLLLSLAVVLPATVAATLAGPGQAQGRASQPEQIGRAVSMSVSPAARDLAASSTVSVPAGPAAAPRTPPLDFRFPGMRAIVCGLCTPPDTNGDAGPNHYIQMVWPTNAAIFDKTGHLVIPPFRITSLWPPGDFCSAPGGDPIVLYDGMADRWLLTQGALPNYACMAVSTSPDPTGTYFAYTFHVEGLPPDYLKFGVWTDAYLMSASQRTYTAYAYDRAKMLAGDPTAGFVKFTGVSNLLLPADLDGPTPPPAGTPGYFYTYKDRVFHGGGPDRIELYALRFDPSDPGQRTFDREAAFPVPPFTFTVCGAFNYDCISQKRTIQKIDALSEWPMHRFPYRNFGDHQTLLGNFTVGGGTGEAGAAIRWFELRNTGTGWEPYQQGTYDPGDGNDRFMGSIAMDGAGDIALGFSVSSSAIFPSIHYTTRKSADPPGAFGPERSVIDGGGSQTGSNRWGDYSAMSVDPANDCTFWYTNQFYARSLLVNWHTEVGVFTIRDC